MPATLVPIERAPQQEPSARRKKLEAAMLDAEEALETALYQAGVIPNAFVAPGADPDRQSPIERVLVRHWYARVHLNLYLERQIEKLRRQLRATLSLAGVTDEQRNDVLKALHGADGAVRNLNAMSTFEQKLITDYRQMDVAGRQMVRTLFDRLAATRIDKSDEEADAPALDGPTTVVDLMHELKNSLDKAKGGAS